ncbi:MAG: hypothetical protein DMG60_12460 [Acidobacteria bacterium]|nr:MAG: hypothetical protein DMG60_12460 [Acidobacteriota bacterium]
MSQHSKENCHLSLAFFSRLICCRFVIHASSLKILLAFTLFFSATLPLAGQTPNTAFLSCWEGKDRSNFQSRRAKTPTAKSSGGFAYAEAIAEATKDMGEAQFCKNKVQLFYSKDGSDYKVVYEKAGLEDQGVGIRVLGWSHTGSQLLVEVGVWGYDRDADVVKSALALDSTTRQVHELPLADAFERVLGKDCEYDSSIVGWSSDDSVLVRVAKTPATTRYNQTFCVDKPTVYAFNLQSGNLQRSAP